MIGIFHKLKINSIAASYVVWDSVYEETSLSFSSPSVDASCLCFRHLYIAVDRKLYAAVVTSC